MMDSAARPALGRWTLAAARTASRSYVSIPLTYLTAVRVHNLLSVVLEAFWMEARLRYATQKFLLLKPNRDFVAAEVSRQLIVRTPLSDRC